MTIKLVAEKFSQDESGATAIEYALIAALIAVGIIAGAQVFSSGVDGLFNDVDGNLSNAFEDDGPTE